MGSIFYSFDLREEFQQHRAPHLHVVDSKGLTPSNFHQTFYLLLKYEIKEKEVENGSFHKTAYNVDAEEVLLRKSLNCEQSDQMATIFV